MSWTGARLSFGGLLRLVAVVVKAGVVVCALSVAFFLVASAASSLYGEYGFHPAENARSWAALTPTYAGAAVCGRCHSTEYVPWTTSKHKGVTCESCHGPLGVHATADPPTPVGATDASDKICILCHEKIVGRPAGFQALVLESHYPGVSCLQCHNTHTTVAMPPPRVTHPLANLPECITCHGATGLQAMPVGHKVSADRVCLACHLPSQTWR